MPNLQKNGVDAPLWIRRDAAFASHSAMVRICALQINAPLTIDLIRKELRVHERGVDPHLPSWCAMQRCSSQQCFKVGRRSDEREEITANDCQIHCGRFATPGAPVAADQFSQRSALSGDGESGHIKINADHLPFVSAKSGQDATCPAAYLENRP